MADPVIPGAIRVLAILQGVSGLPADRFITTFAFASDVSTTTAGKLAAIDKVKAFYQTTYASGTVAQMLSGPAIDESKCEMRAYSLADPPDARVPTISPWAIGALGTTSPLPSEVAVCLSYYQTFNQPRRRGRIYIGPLNGGVVASGTTTGPRLHTGHQATLLAAGLALFSPTTAPQGGFVALADSGLSKIVRVPTNVWVDNAFDTQRRRGEAASSRISGVVVP